MITDLREVDRAEQRKRRRRLLPPDPTALEAEVEEFRRLQPRLSPLWDALTARAEEPYTSVVVPSMTLDSEELEKLEGAAYYEERLLFLLIRLRNPRAQVIYVSSQPVHPLVLEYYLQLLAGIPASHARARLSLLCVYDSSPRPLTEKILERPRLLERIRRSIPDPQRAYLTVFSSTPLERRLAVALGIPLNGVDPRLNPLGTKSGSRKIFRRAGVSLPAGFEDLRSRSDLCEALVNLGKERPDMTRAVVKLDESFSGEGNAIFPFPRDRSAGAIDAALENLRFSVETETPAAYLQKFSRMGGIVEELIDGDVASPSAQLRIDPNGNPSLISTHDQILGGPSGHVYLGCQFPARRAYRVRIQDAGTRIGSVLAQEGVISRFGVDFLVRRRPGQEEDEVYALEINLRMGGTTHPFLALQFLTGGRLDPGTGLFHSAQGHPKYYRSTDNLKSAAYRGLCPEDLIQIVTMHRLHYDHSTESGVLFHMIGALSQYGKLGLTAFGNSRADVEKTYGRVIEVLDSETSGRSEIGITR